MGNKIGSYLEGLVIALITVGLVALLLLLALWFPGYLSGFSYAAAVLGMMNALMIILQGVLIILAVIALFFIAFKVYEVLYYRSVRFNTLKERISKHAKECNDLNDHVEGLKCTSIESNKVRYGHSDYQDDSYWNYKRPELEGKRNAPNVHNCSRAVCSRSFEEPLKYVCKYFDFKSNEETLAVFEKALNDYSAVEDGKIKLAAERDEIVGQVINDIPWLIKKFSKKLVRELGFKDVDLSNSYFPSFVFSYVSSGGNASLKNTVTMDIENLNDMIGYLNERIKWKKSVAGQRALMTSKLREKILSRDNYTCKQCGVSVEQEPHLLLEVDHVIPVSKGGMTSEDNLQTLCWRCNRSKGAKI